MKLVTQRLAVFLLFFFYTNGAQCWRSILTFSLPWSSAILGRHTLLKIVHLALFCWGLSIIPAWVWLATSIIGVSKSTKWKITNTKHNKPLPMMINKRSDHCRVPNFVSQKQRHCCSFSSLHSIYLSCSHNCLRVYRYCGFPFFYPEGIGVGLIQRIVRTLSKKSTFFNPPCIIQISVAVILTDSL